MLLKVKTNISNIYEKLNAKIRFDLINFIEKHIPLIKS